MWPRKIIKTINYCLVGLIRLVFIIKLNHVIKCKKIPQHFYLQRLGVEAEPNIIQLFRTNVGYKIKKTYKVKWKYNNEIRYLEKYSNSCNYIKLPNYSIGDSYICYEFIEHKNLTTEIREGRYSSEEVLSIIKMLYSSIDIMYDYSEWTLIHGDLTPDNVYLLRGEFIFIDYSDSEFYYVNYDKYLFANRVLDEICCLSKNYILKNYFSNLEIEMFEGHLREKVQRKKWGH